jgi:hypothetical protein
MEMAREPYTEYPVRREAGRGRRMKGLPFMVKHCTRVGKLFIE